jgi:hypothetical protein
VTNDSPEISIHTSDPSASAVASILHRVDVALRRAVATLDSAPWPRPEYTRESLPKPVQPAVGGFVITSASEGSLDLVGHFFGEAARLLNSDAAVALQRFFEFLVLGGGAWKFFVSRSDPEDPRGPLPISDAEDIERIIRTSNRGKSDVEVIAMLEQRKSKTEIVVRVQQPAAEAAEKD